MAKAQGESERLFWRIGPTRTSATTNDNTRRTAGLPHELVTGAVVQAIE